jgi:hypothetical protein
VVANFVHYCESNHPPSRNNHVVVVVVITHDFDVIYSHTTTMIFYPTLYYKIYINPNKEGRHCNTLGGK